MTKKDVEAHYPNIDVEIAADELKQEIEHSRLEIEVDTTEVAHYILQAQRLQRRLRGKDSPRWCTRGGRRTAPEQSHYGRSNQQAAR